MKAAWKSVRLGEVLRRSDEMVTAHPDVEYSEITVRSKGKGVIERGRAIGASLPGRRFVARAGQFIISRIGAMHGAMGLVPDFLDGSLVTGDFPLFNLDTDVVEPSYLNWLSRTAGFVKSCQRASHGSTRIRLKEELFYALEIPLPPLAEQRRIVARIEELAARIEEAGGLRKEAEEEAGIYFSTMLQKKRRDLLNSQFPNGSLGNMMLVTSGGTPSRINTDFWDGDIPWVKSGELLDNDISFTEEYITKTAITNSSAKLFPPDTILIALYGQGQTRGRTGRLLISAATNQACCAILPKPKIFEARFIQFWLRSFYTELRGVAQGGAQPNWSSTMIKNITVVVPPLAEQRRIVAELDELQTEVDALKKLQVETASELNALMPAILDRAFKGGL